MKEELFFGKFLPLTNLDTLIKATKNPPLFLLP
jgi:hypothetical protein